MATAPKTTENRENESDDVTPPSSFNTFPNLFDFLERFRMPPAHLRGVRKFTGETTPQKWVSSVHSQWAVGSCSLADKPIDLLGGMLQGSTALACRSSPGGDRLAMPAICVSLIPFQSVFSNLFFLFVITTTCKAVQRGVTPPIL